MLRHCVMFRWDEGTSDTTKEKVAEALRALPGQIPEIKGYAVGADAGLGGDNHDFVVVGDFEDEAGFKVYAEHPAHVAVIKELIRPNIAARAAIQFWL